jgi:hypothetical protein
MHSPQPLTLRKKEDPYENDPDICHRRRHVRISGDHQRRVAVPAGGEASKDADGQRAGANAHAALELLKYLP